MREEFLKNISENSNGCWEWTKRIYSHGYGMFWFKGKGYRAHRASYLLFKGELIDGLVIDHQCRNRACVNPEHLRQVTTFVNNMENSMGLGYLNSLKITCPLGHELVEGNLVKYALKKGKRSCLICMRYKKTECRIKNRDRYNENRRNKRKLERDIGVSE